MLYPQQNDKRNLLDLSGFWDFQMDPADAGQGEGWFHSLPAPRTIAVPASWNDQFQDTRDYLGTAWYRREFYAPSTWVDQRVYLRVGSANYAATVWVNGKLAGSHEGGHLPFACDVSELLAWDGPNTVTIMVDAELTGLRVPPGNVSGGLGGFFRGFPAAHFDFFPYAGIQRPVILYAVPQTHIADVTVVTEIDGTDGVVKLRVVQTGSPRSVPGEATLVGNRGCWEAPLDFAGGVAEVALRVPDARLWSPDDPYLYQLTLTLRDGDQVVDRYMLDVGIRTIAVDGHKILLNGKQVFLKGFGKHEDFAVHGRGLNMPLIVKDNALLKWVGANSYRTSHYPYSEEAMFTADREGFLIVDETPAVGLYFDDGDEGIATRLAMVKQQLGELIARDKNHPSVIMWSLANEPMIAKGGFGGVLGGQAAVAPQAGPFFRQLFDLARQLDPSRLVTVEAPIGPREVEWLHLCDVICLHRYNAWYSQSGRLALGLDELAKDLDEMYETYQKPIAITEFGSDTVAGWHSDPPEMWTEEYQVAQIRGFLQIADARPWMAGMHVWNFSDFKTGQAVLRPNGMNHKGVFTRDRKPKMVAHMLREYWAGK